MRRLYFVAQHQPTAYGSIADHVVSQHRWRWRARREARQRNRQACNWRYYVAEMWVG